MKVDLNFKFSYFLYLGLNDETTCENLEEANSFDSKKLISITRFYLLEPSL